MAQDDARLSGKCDAEARLFLNDGGGKDFEFNTSRLRIVPEVR